MKLRLRSLESKETLKIEVPDSCSLQQLKHTISLAISSSSSSLYLSLNRKDEIHASSPHESLHSIGITSGDLIFYSLDPNAFSQETLLHKPSPIEETDSRDGPTVQESTEIVGNDSPSIPVAEKSPTLDAAEAETLDTIDGSYSEPSTVKRFPRDAPGNDVSDFKLLVFAVHAVILESGFVRVDRVSGMVVNCSHLLDDWPSASSSMISLRYTLPEILTDGGSHCVNLKFQTLGHLVNVYGSLSEDTGSRLHRVCLDKRKFARPVELMLENSESEVQASVNDDEGDDRWGGNEAFELWMMVKDTLALPLLIDLREKAGLDLPPCFMRLPMELKLLILERLPGVDLAKVGSTCSELRYLSSSNGLWKKKFEEEFGLSRGEVKFFKDMFAKYWITKKKAEQGLPFQAHQHGGAMRYFPRRHPSPFGIHVPIWGGQYDLQPVFGIIPVLPPRWLSFIPRCNHHLREFNQ